MVTIHMPIGVIGCGKSSLGKAMAAENPNMMIVSKDAIREMLYGCYAYKPPYEKVIDAIAYTTTMKLVKEGIDVFFDDNNLRNSARRSLIRNISNTYPVKFIAHWFYPSIESLSRRQDNNLGIDPDVWANVYKEQLKEIQCPDRDEGFQEIRYANRQVVPDTAERAYMLQQQAAKRLGCAVFVPQSGICPNCRENVWNTDVYKSAAVTIVTSCPHCRRSFCE